MANCESWAWGSALVISAKSFTKRPRYFGHTVGVWLPNMFGIRMVKTHTVEEWFRFLIPSEYQTIEFSFQMNRIGHAVVCSKSKNCWDKRSDTVTIWIPDKSSLRMVEFFNAVHKTGMVTMVKERFGGYTKLA